MRFVNVTRYVTPLREGGSVPAIVEADDDGMYVLKFRGAAQGAKALVAELVAGELARAVGLPVPEIVFATLDPDLARTEPDPELQDLIRNSGGLNVALDYLPGAATFDPLVYRPDAVLASKIVWFDAFVTNVDRTARNTNMLMWHRRLHLIDHGAALYVHHAWDDALERAADRSADPFALVREHVLLPRASELESAHEQLLAALTPRIVQSVAASIPDALLTSPAHRAAPESYRRAYVDYLLRRLEASRAFLEEAVRAHAALI